MKKKVTYKLEQTKSIIVEVETAEQEQKIKEFNRDFERIDRQNRRIAAKTDSLDRMYEETGYEVIDDGASPEEQYEQKELKNTIEGCLPAAARLLGGRLPCRSYVFLACAARNFYRNISPQAFA